MDAAGVCGKTVGHRDFGAEGSVYELRDVADELVEIEVLDVHGIRVPEGEELARHVGGLFGGLPDPRDVSAGPAVGVDLVCRRARVVEDDSEQVVEVVRNTRGEAAETFEPTRLVQLG